LEGDAEVWNSAHCSTGGRFTETLHQPPVTDVPHGFSRVILIAQPAAV